MRHAMALGPSDIQYFDVNASESAPLPRSKNFRTMHVPVTEDVADLINSDYICRHLPDGSIITHGACHSASSFAETPSRSTKFSTTSFSRSSTAQMNSPCGFCRRVA